MSIIAQATPTVHHKQSFGTFVNPFPNVTGYKSASKVYFVEGSELERDHKLLKKFDGRKSINKWRET